MSAPLYWRIHPDADGFGVSMGTAEAGDVVTIRGFESRAEAIHFIALYWALMVNARQDEATQLLREFVGRGRPS